MTPSPVQPRRLISFTAFKKEKLKNIFRLSSFIILPIVAYHFDYPSLRYGSICCTFMLYSTPVLVIVIGRITWQRIAAALLFIYPIKSLRGISVSHAQLTPQGLAYDRRFMLREKRDGKTPRNMACYHDPSMVRFGLELIETGERMTTEDNGQTAVKVSWPATDSDGDSKTLLVPLDPDTSNLKETKISMHGSETTGYDMGQPYNLWFSECFGLDVELLYVGLNRRPVLGNLSPNVQTAVGDGHEQGLGFSDVAAVLVVSETSLSHVTRRLPEGMKGDIKKFRPNIVVSGAETEFSEDYWRQLDIAGNQVLLTQNCNRCVSLNLDYDTGTFATGPEGKVLANLSKDRRVDPGAKYSPIFGRYGFFHKDAHQKSLVVGDKVMITAKNDERTTFSWPFKVPS